MPPAEATGKPRNLDRHKDRRTLSLPPDLYDLLAQLAEKNDRPVFWEGRRAIEAHLRRAGLLPEGEEEDSPE